MERIMMSGAFAGCRSRADYLRKLIDVENEASPGEMGEIWNSRHSLPPAVAAQLQATMDLMNQCVATPRPFTRTRFSSQANFYTSRDGRTGKSLLVCFCGVANRMMMPVPVFLQLVPEDRFDVLILKDPTGLGYLRGVPGFGDDLSRVTESISGRLDSRSYVDVRCLGVSGGGAAALYAGLLLKAERAISIGGRHRSLSSKLRTGAWPGSRLTGFEFDQAVGGSGARATTRLIAVFGGASLRDREGADSLRQHLPGCELLPVGDLAGHNVLADLLKSGGVQPFLAELLFSPGRGGCSGHGETRPGGAG